MYVLPRSQSMSPSSNDLKDDDRRQGLYSFEAYGTNMNIYSPFKLAKHSKNNIHRQKDENSSHGRAPAVV